MARSQQICVDRQGSSQYTHREEDQVKRHVQQQHEDVSRVFKINPERSKCFQSFYIPLKIRRFMGVHIRVWSFQLFWYPRYFSLIASELVCLVILLNSEHALRNTTRLPKGFWSVVAIRSSDCLSDTYLVVVNEIGAHSDRQSSASSNDCRVYCGTLSGVSPFVGQFNPKVNNKVWRMLIMLWQVFLLIHF